MLASYYMYTYMLYGTVCTVVRCVPRDLVRARDGTRAYICLPIWLEDLEASEGLTVLFTCAGSRVDYALAQSSNRADRAAIARLSCIDACTGASSLPHEQIQR